MVYAFFTVSTGFDWMSQRLVGGFYSSITKYAAILFNLSVYSSVVDTGYVVNVVDSDTMKISVFELL
jgi:hypothetical protein